MPAMADAISGAAPVASANTVAAVNNTRDTFNRPLILVTVGLHLTVARYGIRDATYLTPVAMIRAPWIRHVKRHPS
jgi:hypothetical protein